MGYSSLVALRLESTKRTKGHAEAAGEDRGAFSSRPRRRSPKTVQKSPTEMKRVRRMKQPDESRKTGRELDGTNLVEAKPLSSRDTGDLKRGIRDQNAPISS
eukprot:787128-Pleurochrysis_carterae.AAC.2